jgi:transglutaminase-like putative cysteine protease
MIFSIKLKWDFISNKSSNLYVHLPISNGNQKIVSLKLSKKPNLFFKEKYYSYAKYKTKSITVFADIKAKVKRINKYKDTNDVRFLAKEPNLITSKTRRFVKGLSNAREIYDWILENINRPKSLKHYLKDITKDDCADLKSAIEKKKAMCGGKSLLFVSMCRCIGIPARLVSGYFLRDGWVWLKNSNFHKNFLDMHVWAEFYKKGWWIPVDCNIAQQTGKDYFGKFPNYTFKHKDLRLAVSKGSYFLVDKRIRHSMQTGHFNRGKNLKLSVEVKKGG